MKVTLLGIVFALVFTGCVTDYTPSEPVRTTPNTIPNKTEIIKDETVKIDLTADSIEAKRPELKEETDSIKQGTEFIRVKSSEIKAESIVHDTEKSELQEELYKLTNIVTELQAVGRERQLDEARNIKYGVIGLFALSVIGFLVYGNSIPGTGYTMLGGIMAVVTVITAISWSYLEQYPLVVTGLTGFLVIGALMMYLVKQEKKNTIEDPLGFK